MTRPRTTSNERPARMVPSTCTMVPYVAIEHYDFPNRSIERFDTTPPVTIRSEYRETESGPVANPLETSPARDPLANATVNHNVLSNDKIEHFVQVDEFNRQNVLAVGTVGLPLPVKDTLSAVLAARSLPDDGSKDVRKNQATTVETTPPAAKPPAED